MSDFANFDRKGKKEKIYILKISGFYQKLINKLRKNYYSLFIFKCHNLCIWQFYDHFWSFFCQLHEYLSQNLGFDVHFDVLNVSKFQSDQKIQHKKHFFGFHFFSILEEKILKTYDS